MKAVFILTAALSFVTAAGSLRAQSLSGKVFGMTNGSKEIVPGAVIYSIGRPETGTTANENGVFRYVADSTDPRIVVAAAGYLTDTLAIAGKAYLSILLKSDGRSLRGVTVQDARGSYLSNLSAGKTEVITQRELTKAACCDLAGCFGTQASVQPQTTNVVTNAQELRILGLSGVYNQVLFDGMPMIGGASYTYGISTYPGTVVDNIYVSKGTTSVLQGFESISGQINIESRQPDKTDRLHLNAYVNNFGEKHFNANAAASFGKKKEWSSMLALHSVQPAGRVDNNNDGFLDLPLLTRYMAFNKWRYRNDRLEGLSTQIGLRIVNEQRIGGQTDFDAGKDAGTTRHYGQAIRYTQPEAYVKSTYRFSPDQAISVALSGYLHDQHSWFGTTRYEARQLNAYVNIQHELGWSDKHLLKWGLSYRYQDLKERVAFSGNILGRRYAGDYKTELLVPGIFAENAFHWKNDKVMLITGARLDHHQTWGTYFTPRTMLKWALNPAHTFRASAGTGWRQVNLFSEQINLLASSRDIVFVEPLKPEAAFNWGLSHTWRHTAGGTDLTLSGDFYSTHFRNQFFPDYDSDPTKAYIRNFEGTSRSIGLQLEASAIFRKRLEARLAYNYLDVYRMESGLRKTLPFSPRNRAMGAISYRPANNRWQTDANFHWFDSMRLPNTEGNPEAYRRPLHSSPYATLNIQGTFRWQKLDIYAGCENLFGFVQPNPIISADNPFGPYFDISSVWGPTRGREIYAGVRWSLSRKD
jgi:outer membrane receptor for ferrienterochelin and colicins